MDGFFVFLGGRRGGGRRETLELGKGGMGREGEGFEFFVKEFLFFETKEDLFFVGFGDNDYRGLRVIHFCLEKCESGGKGVEKRETVFFLSFFFVRVAKSFGIFLFLFVFVFVFVFVLFVSKTLPPYNTELCYCCSHHHIIIKKI